MLPLEDALEALIEKTGRAGPFVFGSYQCELCGHLAQRLFTVVKGVDPYDMPIKCKTCGQEEGRFLNLNGDDDDGGD